MSLGLGRTGGKFSLMRGVAFISVSVISLALAGCLVRPEPMSAEDRRVSIDVSLDALRSAPRPEKALSLSEAIALAIRNNRTARVQAYQTVIERKQVDLANTAMLPDILVDAGYRYRNPEYETYNPTFTSTSVAEEKARQLGNLSFSWNILDFGISYLRAQQQADRALLSVERDRKVAHQIVQDTISVWYRAEISRKIQKELDPIMARVNHALEQSRKIEKGRVQEPIEALMYQREMLEVLQSFNILKKDLAGSDYALANMIGLSSEYRVTTGAADLELGRTKFTRPSLHRLALDQRPDIQMTLYESRMTKRDAQIAIMELIPVPSVNFGGNYDSNKYLVANDWFSVSAQIAQNISKLARLPSVTGLNAQKDELAKQQSVLVVGAALLQVDVAYAQMVEAQASLQTAKMQLEVAERIARQMRNSRAERQSGEIQLIREDLRLFLAAIRYEVALLDVKAAGARLMVSTGIDLSVPEADDVSGAAKRIRELAFLFEKGDLSALERQDSIFRAQINASIEKPN